MKQGEITFFQDRVIKSINLLFKEWGELVIPEDAEINFPAGGYVVCNFVMRPTHIDKTDKLVDLLNAIRFDSIRCFQANSGVVVEIFYTELPTR